MAEGKYRGLQLKALDFASLEVRTIAYAIEHGEPCGLFHSLTHCGCFVCGFSSDDEYYPMECVRKVPMDPFRGGKLT